MIFSITGSKDTSIYYGDDIVSASWNTGLDEILEVEKTLRTGNSNPFLIRSLLQFDYTALSSLGVSGSRKFYLKLFATQPENIPLSYSLEINAISQSWQMGVGKKFNTPVTTEGVSWYYKTGQTELDYWASASLSTRGGTWYTGSGQQIYVSYDYQAADLEVDVSSIVEQWVSGTIPNVGFILKLTDAEEVDSSSYGTLKFFSLDTNTIYKPRLDVRYDDSTYITGSITASADNYTGSLNDNSVLYIKSPKAEYKQYTTEKITVVGRDRFPAKTFVISSSQYVDIKQLPSASYYAVKDAYTGEYWTLFDTNYTKISFDGTNNYFNFSVGSLPSGRLYKFVFKITRGSLTEFYDGDFIFKVVR